MPRPLSSTVTELSAWIVIDDVVAVADLRLVDRVVDELEDHVVEARDVVGVPDVHPGALADGLEALQELDRVGGVRGAHGSPFRLCDARRAPAARRRGPARISSTVAARRAQRAVGAAVVRSTAASAGRASKNASTQPSERPASKSSAAKSGGCPAALATALHSASLTRATVRATSPVEPRSASGLPPRVQTRSSRCGPASEWPRRRSSGSSRSQAARRASTESAVGSTE